MRQTENNKITDSIADINFAGMTEVLNCYIECKGEKYYLQFLYLDGRKTLSKVYQRNLYRLFHVEFIPSVS